MGTKGLVLYLVTGFTVSVFIAFLLGNHNGGPEILRLNSLNGSGVDAIVKIWPKLVFDWRSVLATLIGFLGSAFGTVGGVGGGGIFVPMLNLIVGFDTKSAAALSKCMIMGASTSSVWYNLRVPHPFREVPIIDYDLAMLFQPMLMLGITIGVSLSVVFPYWLITVLIIILFLGTSSRSFFRGIEMWKQETICNRELEAQERAPFNSHGEFLIDECDPLICKEEKSKLQILRFNLRWKRLMMLIAVWAAFLCLQIIKARCVVLPTPLPKCVSSVVIFSFRREITRTSSYFLDFGCFLQNGTPLCGAWYWVLSILQFPIALAIFGYEAVKLYKESKKRRMNGNPECVCEATIEWTILNICCCAFCGILGGTVGGLLGSGGGFILGPLLLELGVIPQVASATATFVMMFSSSLSVVEFYLLKRFPMPYALYLIGVSILAGFWGQFFIRKLVVVLKRASLIIFILSGVIFASALTMGIS
ncbi:hypothetical protein GIB67_007476 [Kingdonia uniflora]|uniref:Sulfite exporter TauE/SafE family protein n=1 Tax=Kingdonia uniflora TaxID=39325 RepID=A0A7J7LW23_9MAGN|nr:hypothetical protein GIB67_007476 [Kingdonia uniflora]